MYKNLVQNHILVPLDNGLMIPYINFDNAATTPPLVSVIEEINSFSPYYSSIHRGVGYKSIVSSDYYERAREIVLKFVAADTRDNNIAIFVKNTTEAINKLSYALEDIIQDGIVLVTEMEHHSNILPWRYKYPIDYVRIDEKGRLDLNHLEYLLKKYMGKVKLVAISGASNVTGYINPIHNIAKLSHKYGAKILVDGAQLVPHHSINMAYPEPIDFLAFSGHKIYAPFGTGVLIGPRSAFMDKMPDEVGGGTIKLVTKKEVIWGDLPYKEEAGTPNLFGAITLAKSLETLEEIGMENIMEYERTLTKYALDKINEIPNINIYGEPNVEDKVSIISFNVNGLDHNQVAMILSINGGIGLRNGCFCAQPYVHKLLGTSLEDIEELKRNKGLPRPGMVRISFGMYNDYEEIDVFLKLLKQIGDNLEYYN